MKKIMGMLFLLCILMLPMKVQAETYSGICGDNITWTLQNGALVINGTGDMTDYSSSNLPPWYEHRLSIQAVAIGSNITSIGDYSFYFCRNITNVSIPNTVADIGKCAFSDCWDLPNITLPEGVVSIGERAFDFCYDLVVINIPSTVTSIGEEAFRYCDAMTAINVSAGNAIYSSDSEGVLFNKDKTTLIWYPTGKTNTSYQIPSTVTTIADSAFYSCMNLQTLAIPGNVTSIGAYAFRYAQDLVNLSIPGSVSEIGMYAFYGCDMLSNVALGEGITTIGTCAFEYCDSLTTISLPSTLTKIDSYAFWGCDNLAGIYITANVSDIGNNALAYCGNLQIITVDPANATYCSDVNGVLYSKDRTVLYQYPEGRPGTYYEIPSGVTKISGAAFGYSKYLVDVIVPASVTIISWGAFDTENENFSIYGYGGSYADTFATEKGITFYDLTIVSERFRDIPAGTWYTESVQYVFDNGYMSGKSFNWFDAMNTLTRAEFVTTLYSIYGKPSVSGVANNFSDVENSWYTNSVLWANANGYVSGYTDGRFGVNDNITREQLALILYKIGKDEIPTINDTILNGYTDVSNISGYATEGMKWAVTNGIMSGTPEGNLNPQGNATRAECAVMLRKYCSLING